MGKERQIPIWFFIGLVLEFYGLLILGTGIYHIFKPAERPVALRQLHPDIWWPLLLITIGLLYIIKFAPHRR